MTILMSMKNASGDNILTNNENVILINNIFSPKVNLDIIKLLSESSWKIGTDNSQTKLQRILEGNYSGFTFVSFAEGKSYDPILNVYADIIFKQILHELNLNAYLYRVFWNMYYKNHSTFVHKDMDTSDWISVIYNLHTTDGGTEIDGKFYPDVNGQAKVFKSFIDHKGVSVTKDPVRFNLNMVLKKI